MFDKKGIPIRVGDVLKIFHFTGARRKKHYMYKVVVGRDGILFAMAIHDIPTNWEKSHACQLKHAGNDIEIVEGYSCENDEIDFTDRPREVK